MDIRFALLLACFFLSGFAALLYETAWTRELACVFGTSEIAVAAVLAAYMGGLALGAAAAGRLAPRLRRPVLAYGLLELSVALCALAMPFAIHGLTALYVALLGGREALPEGAIPGASLFQLLAAFAVLLPPTALMGATLPLLARHAVRREQEIGPRVGLLYAVNTAGAVAGTLAAAFLLMPALGLRASVYVGALVNALVFAGAAALALGAPLPAAAREPAAARLSGFSWLLPAVAVSGAASFVYEVLWTRLQGQLLGSSLGAFASMLAGFLIGIALGSAAAARLARTRAGALRAFAWTQLGVALAAMGAFVLSDRLPALVRSIGMQAHTSVAGAGLGAGVLLPMTLCIGASFPLAVRALTPRPEQAAAGSARVYAWNTVGAIIGSLGAGFVLLPVAGLVGTLSAAASANLAVAAFAGLRVEPRQPRLALVAAAAALLLFAVPTPWSLLRTSPLQLRGRGGAVAFAAVGRSSNVLLLEQGAYWRLLTNGLPEAVIARPGAHPWGDVSHWLALLPALARPQARDALVIGLGGGTTVETLPSLLQRIDVVEIERQVVEANRAVAAARSRDPLADARVHIHLGDARGALVLAEASYDIVASQPSHPWTAGASHLYTREFFSLVRSRLRPGGVFAQWIGVRMVDAELLRTLVASLLSVFRYVEVYQPVPLGLVFLASDSPVDAADGAPAALAASADDFARFGIQRPEDVAATLVLDAEGTRAFAAGAPENTDDRNQVAMRAARIRGAALDASSLYRLLAPHDPLAGVSDEERPALVRRLLARGFPERAEGLAEAGAGAGREAALGWLALEQRRPRGAARHFARARELDEGSREALLGLLASQRGALLRGEQVAGLEPSALQGPGAALLLAWRREAAGDWPGLAELDAQLAALEPGDPLFEEAARLRVRWRIETGEQEVALAALPIVDALASRTPDPDAALLRVSAARAAGLPAAAWGSLDYLSSNLPPDGQAGPLARRALELSQGLPETPEARTVRARLVARAH